MLEVMPVITSHAPQEACGKFRQTHHVPQSMEMSLSRPLSQDLSEFDVLETDFEDDSDDGEYAFYRESLESDDTRRRSQTTISSFNEVPTPDPAGPDDNQFEIRFRPVQGPSGPHLFRFSSSSAELDFQHALQMSPIVGPKSDVFALRDGTVDITETPVTATFLGGMSFEAAFEQADQDDQLEAVRSWTTHQVIDWMLDAELDPVVIESFAHHDINGTVLLDLEFEDLKELDIQSFGKRHQLWAAICTLRGDVVGVRGSQDMSQSGNRASRRSPSRSASRQASDLRGDDESPKVSLSASSAAPMRRGRLSSEAADVVLPAESVSIVAIEQLLPKPHNCAKGENCSKWRRQQRQLQQIRDEHGIDCVPDYTASNDRIFIAGNMDQCPSSEDVRISNPHLLQPSIQECVANLPFRPTSEAMPSVVASSDLFGPSQSPQLAVQESNLNQLGSRDPQDNVKHFLTFQHMNSPALVNGAAPQFSELDLFPAKMHTPFPAAHAQRSAQPPRSSTADAHCHLRTLSKLEIPRTSSAGPSGNQCASPIAAPSNVQRRSVESSTGGPTYRLGTPASEMDVPYMAAPMAAPISRDASQSVPPNMQFNPPVRLSGSHSRTSKHDWRRPSMALPALKENEVLEASSSRSGSSDLARSKSVTRRYTLDPAKDDPEVKNFGYGPDCSHAGWMRKRRTKMLRHEWQDAHFRLKGTQLAMHENARLSTAAKETIDVDKYAVACSTAASNGKLSAAMKALHIKSGSDSDNKEKDPMAFAFQLVPEAGERKGLLSVSSNGKTHHFAVKTKDQRIDWMREVMLAKARQQKGKGYEVEVNGVAA